MMRQFLIAIIFFTVTGCATTTAPSGQGTGAENPPTTNAGIRVLCYNIHHANPPSKEGLIDIPAIANVIKQSDPDLVALQEVDVNTERSGKSLNQAEELGRLTGMKVYFAKGIDYQGGEYGVAILSKFPMQETQKYLLPSPNTEQRVLATAIVNLPNGKKIRFASTHLDAQRNDTNRVLQINKINEILQEEKLPMIIAGDFNADPQSRVIATLDSKFTRTCKTNCAFTIPVINPRKTIDFIAYAPTIAFEVKEHRVIQEQYASDHLPVFSILELK